MTDFPAVPRTVLPQFVTTYSPWSSLRDGGYGSGVPASNGITQNVASYMRMTIPWPYPVRRVFWTNGVVVDGNADFGIYTPSGRKVYSTGATAQSGADQPQYVDVTDFVLDPGDYYFALSFSSAAPTSAYGNSLVLVGSLMGLLEQDTAHPLPAQATFASPATYYTWCLCGITRTPSGF